MPLSVTCRLPVGVKDEGYCVRMVACMFTGIPGGAGLLDEEKVTCVATCAGPPTIMDAPGDTEAAWTESPE